MCTLEPAAFIMTRKICSVSNVVPNPALPGGRRAKSEWPENEDVSVPSAMGTRRKRGLAMKKQLAFAGRLAAAGAGLAAASYAAYAGAIWLRYGRVNGGVADETRDALLDQFMPDYEVDEQHHVCVDAPAEVTFAAATEMYLEHSAIVRWMFKAREWAMGSHPASRDDLAPFLTRMRGIGWGVLAEVPGPGDRDGRCHPAVDGRRRLPPATAR